MNGYIHKEALFKNTLKIQFKLGLVIWSPTSNRFLFKICLKINEIWAWPAGAQEWSFFTKNLIANQWNLGLASWNPKMDVL